MCLSQYLVVAVFVWYDITTGDEDGIQDDHGCNPDDRTHARVCPRKRIGDGVSRKIPAVRRGKRHRRRQVGAHVVDCCRIYELLAHPWPGSTRAA